MYLRKVYSITKKKRIQAQNLMVFLRVSRYISYGKKVKYLWKKNHNKGFSSHMSTIRSLVSPKKMFKSWLNSSESHLWLF